MSYLTTLEQLLPVANRVFLRDPYFERVTILSSYKDARVYLRRIIDYAQREPFNYKISLRQLGRIIDVSKLSFIKWLRHNDGSLCTSRRIFWFTRNLIWRNCREARRARGVQGDSDEEDSIEWPTRKTMTRWKRMMKPMRKTYLDPGPVISGRREAEETLQWMLSGLSASSSSLSSTADGLGECSDEPSVVGQLAATEDLGLIGNIYRFFFSSIIHTKNIIFSRKRRHPN